MSKRSATTLLKLWLEPDNINAPVSVYCPSNIWRVFRRHPNDSISIDGLSRVIAPARYSIPTELRITGETIVGLVTRTFLPVRAAELQSAVSKERLRF
jgi:hypothetical protein